MEYDARRTRTDGAVSIWKMLILDGSGAAASSWSASMILMFNESSSSVRRDCPRKAAFSQSASSSS